MANSSVPVPPVAFTDIVPEFPAKHSTLEVTTALAVTGARLLIVNVAVATQVLVWRT